METEGKKEIRKGEKRKGRERERGKEGRREGRRKEGGKEGRKEGRKQRSETWIYRLDDQVNA